MEKPDNNFDAPIPGMAMTAELGGRPWQTPPQYPTVEAAIDYYIERMSSDEFSDQLIDVLEMGVPVSSLVNIMQTTGAMQGLHTIDVGMLISPVLMEFIMFLGDSAGVKYTTGMEDTDEPRKSMLVNSLNKFKKATKEEKDSTDSMDEENVDMTEEVVPEKEQPSGLMARRS
jgi:hypothetical protein